MSKEPIGELLDKSAALASALSRRDILGIEEALSGTDELLASIEDMDTEELEQLILLNDLNRDVLVRWRQYYEHLTSSLCGQGVTYSPEGKSQQGGSRLERRG